VDTVTVGVGVDTIDFGWIFSIGKANCETGSLCRNIGFSYLWIGDGSMNIIVKCAICGESHKTRYYEQWQRGQFHVPAVWICDTHEM